MIRISLVLLVAILLTVPAHAADPRVEFVLLQDPGFPVAGARRWIETLKRASVTSVQIRKGRGGEELKVERRGSDALPSYRVTGALTAKNTLRVPGAEFRITDVTRIQQWVGRLVDGGLESVGGVRNAFGLTSQQLLDVQTALSQPITFSTAAMSRADAIRRAAAPLGVRIDPSVTIPAGEDEPLGEELQGVSTGTGLAILLRPLGAALTISRTARGFQFAAVDSTKVKESWPAGWPLEKDQKLRDVTPQLFKFLEDVQIRGVSVTRLIQALQPRLEMPVFFDQNAMAALEIDPAREAVELPPGRSYYKRILDRALTPAKLKFEVRMDDRDKPFLWITTLRDPFAEPTRSR